MAAAVIGRENELDSIQTFLGGVRDGPAALVIAGEPGIGKTILWHAGVNLRVRRRTAALCRAAALELP